MYNNTMVLAYNDIRINGGNNYLMKKVMTIHEFKAYYISSQFRNEISLWSENQNWRGEMASIMIRLNFYKMYIRDDLGAICLLQRDGGSVNFKNIESVEVDDSIMPVGLIVTIVCDGYTTGCQSGKMHFTLVAS